MILMADKKRMVTQILGELPQKEADVSGEDSLTVCVSEFIDAVHNKDVEAAKAALKACFAEMEAAPHDEYPHGE